MNCVRRTITAALFIGAAAGLHAAEQARLPSVSASPAVRDHRVELRFSYDHLDPYDTYGGINALAAAWYGKLPAAGPYFIEADGFCRKEGNAALAVAGLYHDWHRKLYTYSSVSAGTDSSFLPQLRVDHDFNVKLGPKENIVWTLGGSYIRYFDEHRDTLLSTGLTLYAGRVIAAWRGFRAISEPGSVESYSSVFDLGYGQEGVSWSFITFSPGSQGYMATYVSPSQRVEGKVTYVTLKHRRWLGSGYGVIGEAGFLDLQDGYRKYSVTVGAFKEF